MGGKVDRWSVAHCIDHFRNDVTQSALFAYSFLLAKEYVLDNIMADRGFNLEDVFTPKISPSTFYPFLETGDKS